MTEKKTKPEYQITWPEGAELKMDPKHLMEIRNSLETQFKLMIYKQPGFKFFPSLGNTNFFQHFRTNDGIDFGLCHLYWEIDATHNIAFIDENVKNGEKHRDGSESTYEHDFSGNIIERIKYPKKV